jgi:hypothetical protein
MLSLVSVHSGLWLSRRIPATLRMGAGGDAEQSLSVATAVSVGAKRSGANPPWVWIQSPG